MADNRNDYATVELPRCDPIHVRREYVGGEGERILYDVGPFAKADDTVVVTYLVQKGWTPEAAQQLVSAIAALVFPLMTVDLTEGGEE